MISRKDILKNIFKKYGIYIEENTEDEVLNLDSLQMVNILIEIQNIFMIDLLESDIQIWDLDTFNKFLSIIENEML